VNSVTGEPVPHAAVAVLAVANSRALRSVFSDDEGRFALDGLPAAKYQLTASKRGYMTSFYDPHETFSSAIVTGEGQETEDLTFRLSPGAALRVAVIDDGGDPVENARIMVFMRRLPGLGERVVQVSNSTTDDAGVLEISNMPPGTYFVAVKADPWYAMHAPSGSGGSSGAERKANAALDVAYPVTYYDGATDEAAAAPIVLAEGGREQVTINLHAVPALHLVAHVPRAQDGSLAMPELRQSIFGAEVAVKDFGTGFQPQTGTLEFSGVAPGHYELAQGSPQRILELDASSSVQIDPSAGTPTAAVNGTLRNASGAGLPDGVNVALAWADFAHPRPPVRTHIAQGEFHFPAVPQGNWELWIQNSGKLLPVLSIVESGKTRAGSVITVGERQLSLAVTVAQGETRIEGFARKDGKGLAGAMVVLVPRNPDANPDLFWRDQSDSDGSFSLRDVAPGSYTIVAIEDGWTLEWARYATIHRFLPKGIPVTVMGNSGKLIQLAEPVPVQSR